MRCNKILWLSALTILAGCAREEDTASDSGPSAVLENEDGVYRYVLGFDPATGEPIYGGEHEVVTFKGEKGEAIDGANEPSRLHPDFTAGSEYRQYDAGLTGGETDWNVFASTWWPQSRNGTAWRWQPGASQDYNDRSDVDRLSPMEKYDLMFHPGQERVVEAVSHCAYQDYVDDPENCQQIEHPELTVAGPATEWELENQGVYQWVEPESWWGHCNGWASYATTEELGFPERDIRVRLENGNVVECTDGQTEGCVLWRMADIEALMTELYFSDRATFSGRRCNTQPDDIERDEHGRPTDPACRDLNAASFHVALTGMFSRGARHLVTGEEGRFPAFVIDHNYDHEVWNFPVYRYEIHSQEEITQEQANAAVGAENPDYQFNAAAERFIQVSASYWMISDSVPTQQLFVRADQRSIDPVQVRLNYVLELSADGRILGGEWTEDPNFSWRDSKELHPDFMWMALEPQGYGEGSDDLGGTSDNPFISYSSARSLLLCANDPSTCAPEGGGGGGGGDTEVLLEEQGVVAQNAEARYEVADLPAGRYTVRLSHDAAAPGGDADLYVRAGAQPNTSTYDCRPYLSGTDEECTIDLSSAGSIHIMVRGWSAGDNAFHIVVEGQGSDGGGSTGWAGMSESGSVARGEEDRYETGVVGPGTYVFELTGTNDADLYVRAGAAPTTSSYDCRPYIAGSDETCTVTLDAEDTIHVMVRGWADSSSYELSGAAQ